MRTDLSERQQIALLSCNSRPCSYPNVIPHGVYRSLVIRGLLMPHRDGYEITPEGREYLYDLGVQRPQRKYINGHAIARSQSATVAD